MSKQDNIEYNEQHNTSAEDFKTRRFQKIKEAHRPTDLRIRLWVLSVFQVYMK